MQIILVHIGGGVHSLELIKALAIVGDVSCYLQRRVLTLLVSRHKMSMHTCT